jgi:hypothetical protein
MVQAVQIIQTFGELPCWKEAVQVQGALLEQRQGQVSPWPSYYAHSLATWVICALLSVTVERHCRSTADSGAA